MDTTLKAAEVPEIEPSPSTVIPAFKVSGSMPLHEAAKQLGGKFWTRLETPGVTIDGRETRVVTYDGPSWVLAGIKALKKLDEHSLVTVEQLKAWADEVENISIGVHTHNHPKQRA